MTSTIAEPSARGSADLARPRWPVLSLLAAAQLMLVLDVTVVNVALPDISAALRLDRDTIPWVMTAYTLAFGGLMLLGGRIADIVGPRRIMLTGLTVFTSSSLLCALAANATMLLAGRAAQGVGAAMFSPAALALVTATFTGPSRARALAVWGALSAAGTALGVTIGGVLTTTLGWQWIFAINVPIGMTILVSLPFLVPAAALDRSAVASGRPAAAPNQSAAAPDRSAAAPDRSAAAPGRSAGSLDIPGAVLVTAGTGAVIFGLVNAGSHGWAATSTLLALAAGVALWVAFALTERAVRVPLLRIGLLRERPTAAGAFLMLVATAMMVGEFFVGSFVLQRAHGLSAVAVGLAFLPVGIAVVVGAHLGGRLLTRSRHESVAAAGLTVAAAGQGHRGRVRAGRAPGHRPGGGGTWHRCHLRHRFHRGAGQCRSCGGRAALGDRRHVPRARWCVRRRGAVHGRRFGPGGPSGCLGLRWRVHGRGRRRRGRCRGRRRPGPVRQPGRPERGRSTSQCPPRR